MSKRAPVNIARLLSGKKPGLAVLVDPDKYDPAVIKLADERNVKCFLVGGSRLENGNSAETVKQIKKISSKPVILFPGDEGQLTGKADGLLLLSLLSGQNVEYIIGKHIRAAARIRKSKLPFLSTAYILIRGGSRSTTELVTGTTPLDPVNVQLIADTALAAEQLGFGAIYLEAGSGAANSVPVRVIKKVKALVSLPLIVGGGIDSAEKARKIIRAGANMVVVGNAIEKNVNLLKVISAVFTKPA